MKIIKSVPTSWKLQKELYKDGTERILSGYSGTGYFYYHDPKGNTIIEIDNIIFEAEIKPIKTSRGNSSSLMIFEDKDGIHKYHTGIKGSLEIMQALIDGNLQIYGDAIKGLFTFKKQGTEIYLYPVNPMKE